MRNRTLIFIFMLTTLLLCLVMVHPVNAAETIYIRANGSIEGTTKISSANNITYTFTDNIDGTITIEKDNIALDGAGYSLNGAGAATGIELRNRNNVTIKNVKVTAFQNGIALWYSQSISVSGNEIRNCNPNHGIYSYSSISSIITGNTIENNAGNGIHLSSSSNGNTITQNNIRNNNQGIYLLGDSGSSSISKNSITGNRGDGIRDSGSGNNTISENTVTNNGAYGIRLESSSSNKVSKNTVTYSISVGIGLWSASSYNTISENTITNNRIGVYMYISHNNYNNITGNSIEKTATKAYFSPMKMTSTSSKKTT